MWTSGKSFFVYDHQNQSSRFGSLACLEIDVPEYFVLVIYFLHQFTALACYVIDRFISIIT